MASIQTAGGTVSGSAQEIMVTAAAGVAVVVVLYWLAKREITAGAGALADGVKAAAKAAGDAVDISSDTNLAYRGYNVLGRVMTGDPGFTAAQDLEALAEMAKLPSKAADTVTQWVTGDQTGTLGTKVYDGIEYLKSLF